MKQSEAATVLAFAVRYDNREVTEMAALGWSEALDEDITVELACEAIAHHAATSTEYLKPVHVNRYAARLRGREERKRIAEDYVAEREVIDRCRLCNSDGYRLPAGFILCTHYAALRRLTSS